MLEVNVGDILIYHNGLKISKLMENYRIFLIINNRPVLLYLFEGDERLAASFITQNNKYYINERMSNKYLKIGNIKDIQKTTNTSDNDIISAVSLVEYNGEKILITRVNTEIIERILRYSICCYNLYTQKVKLCDFEKIQSNYYNNKYLLPQGYTKIIDIVDTIQINF